MLPLGTNLKRVDCVAYHPAGGRVAAGGRGVELWDVTALGPVWQVQWDEYWSASRVAFTPDGRCLLALVPGRFRVYVCDAETGTAAMARTEATNTILAVSPADGRVISGSDTGLTSWFPTPPRTDRPVRPPVDWSLPAAEGQRFRGAAFTPAGDLLLTHEVPAGNRPRFALRDPATGAEVRTARCGFHALDGLAFGPDGALLAARLGYELLVWSVEHLGRPPRRVADLRREQMGGKKVTDFAFHPAGRYVATASNDRTVKLFDTATWAVARVFGWDAGRMRSIAFAPDGLTAAAGGEQGQLVLFDVDV